MNITKNLRIFARYFSIVAFVSSLSILLTLQVQKYKSEPKQKEIPQTVSQIDIDSLQKRLDLLEKQEEKQLLVIKKLETDHDSLANSQKQLEKRLQAHTEIIKRICEYVVIITVDKKIIPRQCLPDYAWRREEGQ